MKLALLEALFPSMTALANTKLVEEKSQYRVTKALGKANRAMIAGNVKRREVYVSLGVLNADKTQYERPADADAAAKFDEAMKAIGEQEIGIEFHPVNIADLGAISLEPVHLLALNGILLTGIDDDVPAVKLTVIDGGKDSGDPAQVE